MSAPRKENLDYFPLETGFFADKKIRRLRAKYGSDGIVVLLYLYTQIYGEGYYIDYDDDLILDISDEFNLSENLTRQILQYLFSRSLLDGTLAESVKVLTAASIQRRFQEAKKGLKRDVAVRSEVWLLSEKGTLSFIKPMSNENKSAKNPSKSEINPSKSEKNPTKESKGKERKVNNNIMPSTWTDGMKAAFNEWLQYKSEKRQTYGATGMAQLVTRLDDEIGKRGVTAVISGIHNSMSQGWSGIYFHDDPKSTKPTNTENRPSYDMDRAERKANTTVPKLKKKDKPDEQL